MATNWARGIVASLHLLDLGTRIVIDKALEAKLVITVVSEEKPRRKRACAFDPRLRAHTFAHTSRLRN